MRRPPAVYGYSRTSVQSYRRYRTGEPHLDMSLTTHARRHCGHECSWAGLLSQAFRLGPSGSLQPKVNWTVQQLFDLSGSDRLAQSLAARLSRACLAISVWDLAAHLCGSVCTVLLVLYILVVRLYCTRAHGTLSEPLYRGFRTTYTMVKATQGIFGS
jgi:hypothetical protein